MADERESNDLFLAPNEFAFVQDTTNGRIQTFCGPFAASLTKTDRTVVFDRERKQFVQVPMDHAKQVKAVAPEGWYIQLKNPASSGKDQAHPADGGKYTMPDLDIGRKENIAGPVSFAPWPGQMVRVIQGHHLREDEYVLIRIYDEESATQNWGKQQVKSREDDETSETVAEVAQTKVPENLMTGKLYVIKGTEVSFYIPTTGIEVVPFVEGGGKTTARNDQARRYIRNAVTLERLEYCILLDQDGNKRYVRGPDVVFPAPTENFVEVDGERKFRAFELNLNSGLYIKVIADYEDGDKSYKVGDELFITGKTDPIYFPREEHSIIKYGDDYDVHYGIMIPAGEARYIANRNTGKIDLVKGPQVYLPDPREEVVIRRILEPRLCSLMYPGNLEALGYNNALIAKTQVFPNEPITVAGVANVDYGNLYNANMPGVYAMAAASSDAQDNLPGEKLIRGVVANKARKSVVGDEISRGQKYNPPRALTLNAKYDGAVTINVFEGYAVMLTRKGEKAERRVIIGPQTAMLEYDEIPHVLKLSTGKPKNTDRLVETTYLKVSNNPVTDIIEAESQDFCKVSIKLSYRVTFTGDDDPGRWFAVENYVKFLCDHMRSMVRNEVKKHKIEDFYARSTIILRDLILGAREEGGRTGRLFEENSMSIRDVEVLAVTLDQQIQTLLVGAQQDVIKQHLALNKAERDLEFTTKNEEFKRSTVQAQFATAEKRLELERKEMLTRAENEEAKRTAQLAIEKIAFALVEAEVSQNNVRLESEVAFAKVKNDLSAEVTKTETDALVQRAGAISEKLIASLESVSQDILMERVAHALGPMRIMEVAGGSSIKDVLSGLFKDTPFADRIKQLSNGNGHQQSVTPAE